MLVVKMGALVEFWKARDAAHVAAGTNGCAEIVRSITPQALQKFVQEDKRSVLT